MTLLTPVMTFDPSMYYISGKSSYYQIWLPLGIPDHFDLWLIPGWPLYDFWPKECITLLSVVLLTKFCWLYGISKATWPFDTIQFQFQLIDTNSQHEAKLLDILQS